MYSGGLSVCLSFVCAQRHVDFADVFYSIIMATDSNASLPTPGFKFDNCLRNAYLASKGFPVPKANKTGTTIVGIIYKDGVILGADTRATSDTIVADKNCSKIHYIAPNIYCCGAGTAADTEVTSKMISSQLELHRLSTDRKVPVIAGVQLLKQYLFRYHGYIGAALILGGVDLHGPSLYTIHPHGSVDSLPYVTMGSGSLAAMAVFEEGWREDMSLEDGQQLVRNAICGGIFNDLGSGSNVDMCVITADGVNYIRPFEVANLKGERQGNYRYPRGTTAVLSSKVIEIEVEKVVVRRHDEDMDTEDS